jgi:tetratricopeptide (TPR) repeat protein
MNPPSSLASSSDRLDLPWIDTLPEPKELALEVQRLCQQGEVDPVGVILSRYPELNADRTLVLDLMFEEYLKRREAGEIADADGFCRRFPGFERALRSLIIGHSFIVEKLDQVAADPEVPHLEPGQHLLGFYVLRELGRGTFAQVLLAVEPALGNRLVAIKVSGYGTAEARTLGRLNHPNIVPVYSVQESSSGLSVVCMPYLGTATLDDVINHVHLRTDLPRQARVILQSVQNPVSARYPPGNRETPVRVFRQGTYIDGILHLAVQLAEALAFIHSRGIYHRDLKPSNVLMTPDGRPMLLDFNLSLNKRVTGLPTGGTPAYMPPEQLLAIDPDNLSDRPCLIDQRSDLYSLGVILYELLTGVHPFEPIPLELSARKLIPLLLAKQTKGFPPIRQLNPRVDKALAETIERCLANDPRQRPQTSAELVSAFRKHFSPFHRARRWAALHATFLAAATILGVAGASLAVYFLVPAEPYAIRNLHQGLDRYRQGRYEEAIQSLNQAIDADPGSVEARFARARAFQHLGRIESALSDYEKADELANEQDGRIKACMGYCSNLLAIHDRAIELYHNARKLDFATAEVCNNLGYSYLQWRSPELKADDSLDHAQRWLDEAIKLNDHLQSAYYNRAMLAIQRTAANTQSFPEQGLADIRKAIELGPLTAPLFRYAARLCAIASNSDPTLVSESLNYLEKAVDLGLPPKEVEADFLFQDLKTNPRFQALLKTPPSPEPFTSPVRLVDPIQD